MSIVAIVALADLPAANAALAEAGFGPDNFSVVAYTGAAPSHAALHAWPDAAFEKALVGLAGVVLDVGDGLESPTADPIARTRALIQGQGGQWGAAAPDLRGAGKVKPGTLYRSGDALWCVVQAFDAATYTDDPGKYPALIRRVRPPAAVEPWVQPLDKVDSYQARNPFTGQPDRCEWQGRVFASKIDNNVWSPGAYPQGWTLV